MPTARTRGSRSRRRPALRGGVDLGGTKIQALVLNDRHEVLGRGRAETPRAGGPPAVADAILATLGQALEGAGATAADLAGAGVGSPGLVDTAAGTVANALNLPDWIEPFPLAAHLSQGLGGIPVRLGNDVSMAILGEYRLGAGRPYDSVLGVWWGTGVGGGLVLNREPWDGRGFAGEFGHQVIRVGGRRCGCGNRGCVEAYAGRRNMEEWARARKRAGHRTKLFKEMRKRDRDRLTSGIWARGVRDKDPVAVAAVDRAIRALGAGIASSVNLLDLPAVIVGGGMGDRFFPTHGEQIAARMQRNLFSADNPPALIGSELGDDGGAVGASLLVGA